MPRATLTFTLVALCSAIAFIIGRDQRRNSTATLPVHAVTADQEHAAGLDRRVPRLHLDNVPLDKGLKALADAAGLNIVVSWGALRYSASIQRDMPISLDLTDASARDALRSIIPEGTWNLHGGVISIGGEPDSETRVYDIRDLTEDSARYFYPESVPSPGVASAPDLPERYATGLKVYAQSIMAQLGPEAGISELAGRLIINATPEEHARIATELQQLRANLEERLKKSSH